MYLVVVNLLIWVIVTVNADICDLCVCKKSVCDGSTLCSPDFDKIYCCDGNQKVWRKFNQTIELDNIEWPSENCTVTVSFNNLKLTYLTKVLCASRALASPTLTYINLDNNLIGSITTDPFQYCRNLKSVSIAHNLLARLDNDFVKSSYGLERLNVSHNALAEFNGDILSNNKQLIELDVSHNQITTLKLNEILDAAPNIESINAANNLLFVVSGDGRGKYLHLKYLNLSRNKLTVLTSTSFIPLPNLLKLDLSSNDLTNIETDAFAILLALRVLDLSRNNLNDLTLNLPDAVERLVISSNRLNYWPIVSFPQNLKILELQNNQLIELFNGAAIGQAVIEFPNITKINVSQNHIETLSSTLHYPALKVLDLSFNHFAEMPQSLGLQAPNMDWLRMNGNPLRKIEFTQKMYVRKLELSDLPSLTELDASQFDRITSKSGCVALTVSRCPHLRNIQNSFLKLPNLCHLDLSYNGLSVVNQNWANWSAVNRGIDFQGNPISCTCVESQWLLDTFLPMMYERIGQQHYVNNFRCASPDRFKQQRLIKYFRQEAIFCDEHDDVNRAYLGLFRNTPTENSPNDAGTDIVSLAIIVALSTLIVACAIAITVIWTRRRHARFANKNNRRYSNGGFF